MTEPQLKKALMIKDQIVTVTELLSKIDDFQKANEKERFTCIRFSSFAGTKYDVEIKDFRFITEKHKNDFQSKCLEVFQFFKTRLQKEIDDLQAQFDSL